MNRSLLLAVILVAGLVSFGNAEIADDAVKPALTASDAVAERTASEAANLARIERELAELRAQLEALNLSAREEE